MDRRDRLRRNGTHTHTTARAIPRGGHTVTTRGDADHNPRDESQPVSDEHVAADMSAPFVMMNRERRLTIMTATEINDGAGHPGRRADARNQTPATDRGVSSGRGAPAMLRPPAAADHRRPSQIDGAPDKAATAARVFGGSLSSKGFDRRNRAHTACARCR